MAAHRFAIFCKSFEEDFARLRNLVASCDQFCPGLPLLISVPRKDEAALRRTVELGRNVSLVFDEDYAEPTTAGSYGWYQQQVCKLSIHRSGFAESYLSIDSDAYLIGPIDERDFLAGDRLRIVYSRLFTKYLPTNAALLAYILDPTLPAPEPPGVGTLDGFASRLAEFQAWLSESGDAQPVERGRWINHLMRVPAGTSLQPGQILHASLLARMERFFHQHGLPLGELIRLVPWEYNWYGAWCCAAAEEEVAPGVSPIVHFASDADVAHAQASGVTSGHLARRFKVVQMAARHFDATVF